MEDICFLSLYRYLFFSTVRIIQYIRTRTEVVAHESYEAVGRGQVQRQRGKGRRQDVEAAQQP